ncbi:MAG: flagellar biosynthesis anti-sigma factor FlgM [Steroidobacteraceae bacterium]
MTTIHRGQDVNGLVGPGSGSAEKAQAAQSQSAQPLAQMQPAPSSQPGEVQITPAAQLLAKLERQLSGTPDVNQSRVDAIRQALDNGSYQIDSSRVADGLLTAQRFDAQASSGTGSGTQSMLAKAFADTAKG